MMRGYLFGLAVLLVLSCKSADQDYLEGVDQIVIDEIDQLDVKISSKAKVENTYKPETNNTYWDIISTFCGEGGYDLESFSGQTLSVTQVDIEETCQGYKLKLVIMSNDESIACAYLAIRDDDPPAPGIYPVNKEDCPL